MCTYIANSLETFSKFLEFFEVRGNKKDPNLNIDIFD